MFNWTGAVQGVWNGLLIILGAIIIIGLIYYIYFVSQFKNKMIIKEVVNGRKVINFDKYREFTDSEKVPWIQLYKNKSRLQAPPPEAVEINKKGKKVVEAYKTETGEFIYAKDIADVKDVPDDILKIKDEKEREAKIKEWRKDNYVISAYQPLTTKQRLILINQIKKAMLRQKKQWQDYILPVAGIMALVILVVALMIFWGDIAKPLLEMKDKQVYHDEVVKEQLEIINAIHNDIQIIKQEQTGLAKKPPN